MRVLAVDSAATSASAAAVEDGEVRAELVICTGRTHSRHLMEMIDQVLRLAAWKPRELDALAVTRGPGSFTGLRIGISTVKGLAMALDKPLAGVSSLESLALQCAVGRMPVCALIDGRKGEVYRARYRPADGALAAEGPEAVLPPAEAVGDVDQPTIFCGSGALLYRDLIRECLGDLALFAPPGGDFIRGGSVAQLAMAPLRHPENCRPERLVPRYIRRPDAEVNPRNPIFA